MKKFNVITITLLALLVGCGFKSPASAKRAQRVVTPTRITMGSTVWKSPGSEDGSLAANWSNGLPGSGTDMVLRSLAEGGSDVNITSGLNFTNTASFNIYVSANNKSQLGTPTNPVYWGGNSSGYNVLLGQGKAYLYPDTSSTANPVTIVYNNAQSNWLYCVDGSVSALYNLSGRANIGGDCTISTVFSMGERATTVIEAAVGAETAPGVRLLAGFVRNERAAGSAQTIHIAGGQAEFLTAFPTAVSYTQYGGYVLYQPKELTAPAFNLDVWDGTFDASQNEVDVLANAFSVDKGPNAIIYAAQGFQVSDTAWGVDLSELTP